MTVRRGAPSASVWRIIEMNGAMPVPVETNRCVRSSSGSSRNLPFGPIIRIRWPTGSRHSSGVNVHDRDEPDVELVAVGAGVARRGRDRVRPLHELAVGEDADRHVLAGLERGRLAVELHPEVGEVVGLVDAPHERRVVLRRARAR